MIYFAIAVAAIFSLDKGEGSARRINTRYKLGISYDAQVSSIYKKSIMCKVRCVL